MSNKELYFYLFAFAVCAVVLVVLSFKILMGE